MIPKKIVTPAIKLMFPFLDDFPTKIRFENAVIKIVIGINNSTHLDCTVTILKTDRNKEIV
jgi:hypothetical protein